MDELQKLVRRTRVKISTETGNSQTKPNTIKHLSSEKSIVTYELKS